MGNAADDQWAAAIEAALAIQGLVVDGWRVAREGPEDGPGVMVLSWGPPLARLASLAELREFLRMENEPGEPDAAAIVAGPGGAS